MELLTFSAGQLRDLLLLAQNRMLDQLAARLPETADVVAAHPDPQHPVRQAAATYLHRFARLGRAPDPADRSIREARDQMDAALTASATDAKAAVPDNPPPALPDHPRLMADVEAAAAWRTRSPAARHDAERYMEDLVRAHTNLAVAQAAAAQPSARPRNPDEATEADRRDYFEQRLKELNNRHSVLMHGSVLAEAETAATQARHQAVVDAAQATLPRTPRTTAAETEADHEAFTTHITAAEKRIDQALDEQRQHARNALARHFPTAVADRGLHHLRTQLMDRAGLGLDSYRQAHQAVTDASRTVYDLKSRLASGRTGFGKSPVTAEQVTEATAHYTAAEQRFGDISVSQARTLEALNALGRVAALAPTGPEGRAALIAQITAQSRERALPTPAEPRPAANQACTAHSGGRQAHDGQNPQNAPRPGMR
ncbi:hypothetical protein ACFYNX_26240 [Streptomyces sp. NPDC007872]|uniref:hypothetical protein n=1 Tax=Streptomyces sp. NPDC007872 TaxID=3364782 RepID=UPI0036A93B20